MGLFKNKMPSKKKKILSITISEEINDVVAEYCEKSGIQMNDVGFAIGRLCSDQDLIYQLSYVMSIYFKAAIYYAKENKDPEFKYEYLTKKDFEKIQMNLLKKEEEILRDLRQAEDGKHNASYIG